MIPFHYIEFYDVPRTIALRYRGSLFLLQSAFDEHQDDYPTNYTVYTLPESVAAHLENGSWAFLDDLVLEPLGQLAIEEMRFDSTKRKTLDASLLDRFIR